MASDLFYGHFCLPPEHDKTIFRPRKPVLGALTAKPQKTSLKEPVFQNSEYEVNQIGPKDSGNQNFSFIAPKGEAEGVTQILCHTGTGNGA
jgi:hypothetical protein